MIGWFRRSPESDPREVFPIENLPIETYSERSSSGALRVLYRPPQALPSPPKRIQRSIDEDKADFFRRILPILDGFDELIRHANLRIDEGDEHLANWLKTLDALHRRLLSALEKEGLVAIESLGMPLDLSIHEVVKTRPEPSVPNNTVVEEMVRGYRYGQRVLRDAKVVVARNESPDTMN